MGETQMTKTNKIRKNYIQVFIVSWFPMYAQEASTIMAMSREHATRIISDLETSFATQAPSHDPRIHVEKTEVKASC